MVMTLWVAPTEPVALKALPGCHVSMFPETWGCDVLAFVDRGELGTWRIGVQRKEVNDLIQSAEDGRLAKELAQMTTSSLDTRALVVEGSLEFHSDGAIAGRRFGRQWTCNQVWGLLWGVEQRGVSVWRTRSINETVAFVQHAMVYWTKEKHAGVSKRPAAPSAWGKAMNHEWGAWVLQGWPGIGSELASRIMQHFGRLPVKWDITPEELAEVQGISLARARKIIGGDL